MSGARPRGRALPWLRPLWQAVRAHVVPASVCLGAAAALLPALVPLLDGLSWLAPTLVVMSCAAAVPVLLRLLTGRSWPGSVLAPAVVVWCTGWLCVPGTFVAVVVPTPRTLEHLAVLLPQALRTAHDDIAPVAVDQAMLSLVTLAMGLCVWLMHLAGVTLRSPAVAGLPLLAGYCVPAVVLDQGVPWRGTAAAAAGYLALLAWGAPPQQLPAGGHVRTARAPRVRTVGALEVTAVVLVLTVLVPGAVPGLENRRWTGGGQGTTATTSVNPILDLREDLTSGEAQVAFTVTTSGPTPGVMRLVTDDVFTGESWQPGTSQLEGTRLSPGLEWSDLTYDGYYPLDDEEGADVFTVTSGSLVQQYLPLPLAPSEVDVETGWVWYSDLSTATSSAYTTAGLDYSVTFWDPTVSADDLRDVTSTPADVLARYTGLPEDTPASIGALAQQVAGDGSTYEQVVALQRWFRSTGGFTYSTTLAEDVDGEDSGLGAVESFLRTRRGYCVQFASSMAVMARSLGIPARVAVGFLPGDRVSADTWQYSTTDAHAWPEIYFEGYGWVRFEPTPSGRTGAAPDYAEDLSPEATAGASTSTSTGSASSAASSSPATVASAQASTGPDAAPATGTAPTLTAAPATWVVWPVALLLAAAAGVPVARRLRRRRARGAGGAGAPGRPVRRDDVDAQWRRALAGLDDLGLRVPDHLTVRRQQSWIAEALRGWEPATAPVAGTVADGATTAPTAAAAPTLPGPTAPDTAPGDRAVAEQALATLVDAVEFARYAPPHADRAVHLDRAREAVTTVLEVAAARAGRRRRIMAVLVPVAAARRLLARARHGRAVRPPWSR